MGWNKPSEEKKVEVEKRGGQWNVHFKGLLAGAIIVVCAAIAAWWLWPDAKCPLSTSTSTSTSLIKEVTPAAAPAPEKPAPEKPKKYSSDPSTQFALKRRAEFQKQLETDPVLQFHMTNQAPSKMLYKTATEQALDFIFNTPVGDPPPPLPLLDIPKYELDKLPEILAKAEVYDKDESLELRERRMRMQQVKNEFKKFTDEGGEPREFLNYYYQELERSHGIWQESQKLAVEAARFDDPAAAREFIEKVNADLAEKGIEPVKLRPSLRKRLGLQEETTK